MSTIYRRLLDYDFFKRTEWPPSIVLVSSRSLLGDYLSFYVLANSYNLHLHELNYLNFTLDKFKDDF